MTRARWLALAIAADVVVLGLAFLGGWVGGARNGYDKGYIRGAAFVLQQDVAALKHCRAQLEHR